MTAVALPLAPHHDGFHTVPAAQLHRGDRLLVSVDEKDQPLTVCTVLAVVVHAETVEVALPGVGCPACLYRLSPASPVEVADEPAGGESRG